MATCGTIAKTSAPSEAAIGVGVVAAFSLLVVGRLFAGVTMLNAVLLFIAPLLAWLPEFFPSRPRGRAA